MELKLNIYEGRNVVKTYETDTYAVMFGTVEDLLGIMGDDINIDDNAALIAVAGKVVTKENNIIKPLFKEIFEGLTDEELRHTRVKDMARVLMDVVKYTVKEILEGGEKN